MVTMERIETIRAVTMPVVKNICSPSIRRAKAMENRGIGVFTIYANPIERPAPAMGRVA